VAGDSLEWNLVVTDTAKSKTHRYLSDWEIAEALEDPDEVYYERGTENYFVKASRTSTSDRWNYEREETIVLIVTVEDKELIVITQTGPHDHYHWDDYVSVEEIGATPEEKQGQ